MVASLRGIRCLRMALLSSRPSASLLSLHSPVLSSPWDHHACARLTCQAVSSSPPNSLPLLRKLRLRQQKDRPKPAEKPQRAPPPQREKSHTMTEQPLLASSFQELGLCEPLLAAAKELNLSKPTEVQCLGIPAALAGESLVLASHTGSGKTLAYMFPIVQHLKMDEEKTGKACGPRRPRAVVLCPTRELAEQVYRVAKSLCHHARFRPVLIGGGSSMKIQEDALNNPVDMLVGTPGRLLMHVSEGNMAYGDIKYVVLDEADTMFDRGFGLEVRKFLDPLRNRSLKPGDEGFQTILVTATITKAVQHVLDEEFPGIRHLHTSTLHKRIPTARHSFIKISGNENKLESLLQVLEPSLAKGERVMVFCNTLNSCRAVDHFINEHNMRTVNYHGDVPAEERVEGLNKFRDELGDYPVLVCTDLAARGLDLVVDHVIMFDFPLNPIDYLHRTGRTARMGAKGKITSLVTKRDLILAEQIEEGIRKGQSLEALTTTREKVETKKVATKLKQHRKPTMETKVKQGKKLKIGYQKLKDGKPVIKLKQKNTAKTHESNGKQRKNVSTKVKAHNSPLKKSSNVQLSKRSNSGSKILQKNRSKKAAILT